ncbi:glycosyltransferase family 4 protein [Sphingomonas sp. S2-65]|uniref:glycosyltransferase family 4 protein n=1 Tax=Sphingomonas sp. S2-65 TaxID=2903960 RepID=UPI001F1DF0EE|nr:glycosyltransferase family 4 protein [Sphingomonas sp. S2-65]UYY57069.1 glycosyltransferase family 4 protein [Sphingomonas sp. S2-65]
MGILATEYLPATGGMEQHAASLIAHAAERLDVTLITWPQAAPPTGRVRHVASWTGFPGPDRVLIKAQPVDAWLVLNAGWLLDVAEGAQAIPLFAYVHGNDFISPWVPGLSGPVALVDRLERKLRMGDGGDGSHAARWWRRKRVITGLRRTRLIFANSHYTRGRCLDLCGLPDDRAQVVAPGIDDRHFKNMVRPRREGRLQILTVSRLSSKNRRKNVDGLLKALAIVRGEIDAELSVVGDGDDLPRLTALTKQLGISERVHFMGRLDDAALDRAYESADLFVLAPRPSRSDVEGFGMVYVEAAARGLPVIGTAVGGVVDAINDGVSGVFAENASPEAIAAALARFAASRKAFDPVRIRQFAELHRAAATSRQLLGTIEALAVLE